MDIFTLEDNLPDEIMSSTSEIATISRDNFRVIPSADGNINKLRIRREPVSTTTNLEQINEPLLNAVSVQAASSSSSSILSQAMNNSSILETVLVQHVDSSSSNQATQFQNVPSINPVSSAQLMTVGLLSPSQIKQSVHRTASSQPIASSSCPFVPQLQNNQSIHIRTPSLPAALPPSFTPQSSTNQYISSAATVSSSSLLPQARNTQSVNSTPSFHPSTVSSSLSIYSSQNNPPSYPAVPPQSRSLSSMCSLPQTVQTQNDQSSHLGTHATFSSTSGQSRHQNNQSKYSPPMQPWSLDPFSRSTLSYVPSSPLYVPSSPRYVPSTPLYVPSTPKYTEPINSRLFTNTSTYSSASSSCSSNSPTSIPTTSVSTKPPGYLRHPIFKPVTQSNVPLCRVRLEIPQTSPSQKPSSDVSNTANHVYFKQLPCPNPPASNLGYQRHSAVTQTQSTSGVSSAALPISRSLHNTDVGLKKLENMVPKTTIASESSFSQQSQNSDANQIAISSGQSTSSIISNVSSANINTMTIVPQNVTKEWHRLINNELREHLITKLFQVVVPAGPQIKMLPKLLEYRMYLEKFEQEVYERANTKAEYYHFLAEKYYKIHVDFNKRRQEHQERKAQHSQQQQQQNLQQSRNLLEDIEMPELQFPDEAEMPLNINANISNNQSTDTATTTNVISSFLNNMLADKQKKFTKEWHKQMGTELREILVKEFAQKMLPISGNINDSEQFSPTMDERIKTYAKKIECDIYEKADSRIEYYDLLADKYCKTQEELRKGNFTALENS